MTATRDDIAWLSETERRIILPLKWVLLLFCVVYWLWDRNWIAPTVAPFALFVVFFWLLIGQHYFFARDRITPKQLRPFLVGLFLVDLGFVGALIAVDILERNPEVPVVRLSAFTPIFILCVLRGIALFQSRIENLLGFILIVFVYVMTGLLQLNQARLLDYMSLVQQLSLLLGVMLVTQAFVLLVNSRLQEMIASRERIVRSESLASLGELSAGIAHEINNPIGIIKTYVDFLDRSVKEDDPLREDFSTIRREADRCQEIVRRMLDFSNPETKGFQPVILKRLLQETADFVFHEGESGRFGVKVSETEEIPVIAADPIQLRQAFLNILLNARQIFEEHNPDPEIKGRIDIDLTRGHGLRAPVRVIISDNGPGISAEDARKVFEPFYTRRAKGTGLGLSITQRIVEAHGGTIKMQPRPTGGTSVIIDLPIMDEEKP